MMHIIRYLQNKWQVSLWGFVAIFVTFALAGSSVVKLKDLILNFILPGDAPTWLRSITYLALIFPLYQILLVFYGTLLGQFSFFWEKEKKIWGGVVRLIRGRKKSL